MLDNQLIASVIEAILKGELIAGIQGTPLAQAFQPTEQGVNSEPTIFFYKVADKRLGSPGRSDVYDEANQRMVHTELQQYETTFQMSALALQSPQTEQNYTASDILNLVAYILQSEATIDFLQSKGIGIEKINDVRNPYFKDDADRYEANPSMDIVFTHKQIISNAIPVIIEEVLQIITV